MKKFIVIDGFDGSGKDTQSRFIYKMYKNIASKNSEGITEKIVLRSHPEDDNYFGLKSHQALLKEGKANKILATIFYIFDAIRSLILYYPKTDILIFSRYHLAVAYLPKSVVKPVYSFFNFILPTSQYMFYLDLSPEIAMERIRLRSRSQNQKLQIFENVESLRKIRQKANLISFNWIIIDASKDKNDIKDELKNILLNKY